MDAHSKNQAGFTDSLKSHQQSVALRAAGWAKVFSLQNETFVAGMIHDLGKYGDLFQRRLLGKEQGIDHWSAGAWIALKKYKSKGVAVALAIQGHHIGLQKGDPDSLKSLDPQRLIKCHPLGLRLSESDMEIICKRFSDDGLTFPSLDFSTWDWNRPCVSMLDVRMLFSALVDADFIETEAHFQVGMDGKKNYRRSGPLLQPDRLLPGLNAYLDRLGRDSRASSSITAIRKDLLQACRDASTLPPGTFTLTAPTGSGKTLSMLAFALNHAKQHNLKRIILILPYLNIIEQTAQEYRRICKFCLGKQETEDYLLEHHSLSGTRSHVGNCVEENPDDQNESCQHKRFLTENWDAPIVITTSVQLLESLFSNRPAACRKLHNLAQSVILFDEVQTLPIRLAIPTLATLSHLAERYGVSIVFSTATQPAFTHLNKQVKKYGVSGWQPREIVPPGLQLFRRSERIHIEWPEHKISWPQLADRILQHRQVLCIVNLKRHALTLYNQACSQQEEDAIFHLSTNMCPAHRLDILSRVRERLKNGSPCCLISTQCIEAGIDIDFPAVFRAFGPLDAIAQAAGRCNRNGGPDIGRVCVFVPEEDDYPDPAYRQATSITRALISKYGAQAMSIYDLQRFEEYYQELYSFSQPQGQKSDLEEAIQVFDFVETARHYHLINQDAINILVPYDTTIFQNLRMEIQQKVPTRYWFSKAQPYAVSLFRPRIGRDLILNYLDPVPLGNGVKSDEWFLYLNGRDYDKKRGLVPPDSWDGIV